MKRKIKFRGKCAGTWRKGDHLTYANGEVIKAWMGAISPEYDVEPETVGQFTEAYDIDRTEIYDGDILENQQLKGKIYKVAWISGSWVVLYPESTSDDKHELLFEIMKFYDFKVIGNIYDNPELWKGAA